MKAYVGLVVELHSFFNSELDQDKQSVSSQGHFTPVDRTTCTRVTGGWVGAIHYLLALEKMEISHFDHELNHNSLIIQPITYSVK
jgi:hypothetical protein